MADMERSRVGDNVAAMLRAYRKYFSAVAKSYSEKGSVERFEIERGAAGRRTAADESGASVERLAAEPGPRRIRSSESTPYSRVRIDSLMRDGARAGLPLTRGCTGTF